MACVEDQRFVRVFTDRRVRYLWGRQYGPDAGRNAGGFDQDGTGYADSRNSIYEGNTLLAAYLSDELPQWRGAPELLQRVRWFLEFLRRRQRANGIVMLGASATPSCSEIGFTLPACCLNWRAARKAAGEGVPGAAEIADALEDYIRKGAAAVRALPPMTSNHRWTALAAPLAMADKLFPDPANGPRLRSFLDDGIDIDEDGLYYEERSPNYNMVANQGLIWLADALGRREYLELAARNARLQLRMIQPGGEVDTSFSHRQDRGAAGVRAFGVFYVYRRLALEFGDGELARAADLLREQASLEQEPHLAPLLSLYEDLRDRADEVARRPLPEAYELRLRSAPLWRWRRGAVAATVAADRGGHWWDAVYNGWGAPARNNNLLCYHAGSAILDGLKLLWGTGSGGMRPEAIEYAPGGGLVLCSREYGCDHIPHYRPGAAGAPFHLDFDLRARMELERRADGGLELTLELEGEADCPINLQLLLRAGQTLHLLDGSSEPTVEGGRTYMGVANTAGATGTSGAASAERAGGVCWLCAQDGSALQISGLPAGEHRVFIGDGSAICGEAERRSHRLICGLFSPVMLHLTLQPGCAEQANTVSSDADEAKDVGHIRVATE